MVNFCPVNPYLSPQQAVESFRDHAKSGSGRYFLAPLPEESEGAYGRLMDEGIKQGEHLLHTGFCCMHMQHGVFAVVLLYFIRRVRYHRCLMYSRPYPLR